MSEVSLSTLGEPHSVDGIHAADPGLLTALEKTQGQMDGSSSQFSYKCHLEEAESVRDMT
jgi:hypothetical protein